jgi:predicted glycosyltransferase
MKILIDINHPAHVHYFKNMIKIMKAEGHDFLVISRNKEIEHYLLKQEHIPFVSRGEGSNSFKGKFIYFFYAIYFLVKQVKRFKPDIVISFGTPYPAIAAWLLGKPHISINDTEHAKMHHYLTDPFSKAILTPSCYNKNLGSKQIRFNGYMELCYLHPNYFKPDKSVLKMLKVNDNERFVIIRFVSWNAAHDVGQIGLTLEAKHLMVKELSKYAKVFISSESKLPEDLEPYKLSIPPEKIHDVLAFATLFIGEGATMASECACLGTPAIYVNSLEVGYCTEEENKYQLVYGFRNSVGVIDKALALLTKNSSKTTYVRRKLTMLNEKIDPTAFFTWFFEDYPNSLKTMKKNPDYQNNFR